MRGNDTSLGDDGCPWGVAFAADEQPFFCSLSERGSFPKFEIFFEDSYNFLRAARSQNPHCPIGEDCRIARDGKWHDGG